jgi:hypothetical protein
MDGICDNDNCPYCRGKTRVIYPDLDPTGMQPEQLPVEPTEVLPAPVTEPVAPLPDGPVQPTSYDQPEAHATAGAGRSRAKGAVAADVETSRPRLSVTRLPEAGN